MLDSGLMCNTVCNLMDWMGAGSEIDNSLIVKRNANIAGKWVRKARKKTAVLVSVWINEFLELNFSTVQFF